MIHLESYTIKMIVYTYEYQFVSVIIRNKVAIANVK